MFYSVLFILLKTERVVNLILTCYDGIYNIVQCKSIKNSFCDTLQFLLGLRAYILHSRKLACKQAQTCALWRRLTVLPTEASLLSLQICFLSSCDYMISMAGVEGVVFCNNSSMYITEYSALLPLQQSAESFLILQLEALSKISIPVLL